MGLGFWWGGVSFGFITHPARCNEPTKPKQVDIVDKAHMPLVAFALKPELKLPYTVFEIQDKLRERG